jgi:hypothetical protein
MGCPCGVCHNKKYYSSYKILNAHLLWSGFMPSYNCWSKQGERWIMMEDNEEEDDDDNYPMFPTYSDIAMGDGNADRCMSRERYRGGGTEARGPGGPAAHPERDGDDGELGGGRSDKIDIGCRWGGRSCCRRLGKSSIDSFKQETRGGEAVLRGASAGLGDGRAAEMEDDSGD